MSVLQNIHLDHGAMIGEYNGARVPAHYGNLDAEYTAVRRTILLTDYSHLGVAEVVGEGAFELLNVWAAGDVSLIRDEQGMYTVILDEAGQIVSDVYILCDDERFIVMSEWLSGDELSARLSHLLARHDGEFEEIERIASLNGSIGVLHFEGPYSWELMAEFYGIDVVGLPFQGHMPVGDDGILFRSGKHGEFSYKLIAPRERLEDIWNRARTEGAKYDLAVGGLDYRRLVRLENPCWEPGTFSAFSRSPIELQMQWAVRYDKDDFVGKEALARASAQGAARRAVGFTVDGPSHEAVSGDKVYAGDVEIGVVVTCGYSKDNDATLGRLMLDADYAYAEIGHYEVSTRAGRVAIRTAAIPFYRNFSFFVNPSEHSYVDASRPKHLLDQAEREKKAQAGA